MMVIIMIGLCSVLGYAMLWGASTNAQIADNAVLAAKADALAESGVNLAIYYLRYPANAPAAFLTSSDSYVATNVSLGTGIDGYVNLQVDRITPQGWEFQVKSTGVAQDGPLRVAQTLTSNVKCQTKFDPRYVLSSQSDIALSTPGSVVITGKVQTKGQLDVASGVMISDYVYTYELTGSSVLALVGSAPYQTVAPSWSQIKDYGQFGAGPTYTYTHNGDPTCQAAVITGPIITAASLPALGTNNPLRIYICNGDLTVFPSGTGNISMTGSLIVRGDLLLGNAVTLNAASRTLTVNNPMAGANGAPGLIVQGAIRYLSSQKRIITYGVNWVGTGIHGDAANNAGCSFRSDGAFLTPLWSAAKTFIGSLYFNPNTAKAAVADFASVSNQVPTGVIVQSFTPGEE